MDQVISENSAKAREILSRMFAAEKQFMESDSWDFDGIAKAFHRDIVVHEPASLPYAGDWRGFEALGQLFKRMHDAWSLMDVEDMRATIDGDTLFMGSTLVATARHSGQEIRQPFAEILKIKDGLVIEGFPYYSDTVMVNAALGFTPREAKDKD